LIGQVIITAATPPTLLERLRGVYNKTLKAKQIQFPIVMLAILQGPAINLLLLFEYFTSGRFLLSTFCFCFSCYLPEQSGD
jgi:hypothetical protein